MKQKLAATVAVVCAVAGCGVGPDAVVGAPDPDMDTGGQALSSGGSWQKVMTCNGGAAVLDVDSGERRNLQLVIRDADAVNYLTGAVGQQLGPLNRGNGRELIVTGTQSRGVFWAGDFSGLSNGGASSDGQARAYREGNGIKVVFERRDGSGRYCIQWATDPGSSSQYCELWADSGSGGMRELANWYFDSCN